MFCCTLVYRRTRVLLLGCWACIDKGRLTAGNFSRIPAKVITRWAVWMDAVYWYGGLIIHLMCFHLFMTDTCRSKDLYSILLRHVSVCCGVAIRISPVFCHFYIYCILFFIYLVAAISGCFWKSHVTCFKIKIMFVLHYFGLWCE